MPFTPFHLGPALLICLLLFPLLDVASFLVASVIVDIEPLYLMSQPSLYLHGFFHSYLGASIFGILTALGMYSIRKIIQRILKSFLIQQKTSFQKILFTSLLGVYFHVFLDSFLYGDIRPLYPLEANPFLNAASSSLVYAFCTASFLLGFAVYVYRVVKARKPGISPELH